MLKIRGENTTAKYRTHQWNRLLAARIGKNRRESQGNATCWTLCWSWHTTYAIDGFMSEVPLPPLYVIRHFGLICNSSSYFYSILATKNRFQWSKRFFYRSKFSIGLEACVNINLLVVAQVYTAIPYV